MKRISTRSPQETWSNRGFHLFLFLLITLFALTLRLVKVSAENVHVKKEPIVVSAAETNPLISPLPQTTPTPSPTPLPNKWLQFKQAAEKVSQIYNFPVNVVLAQGALESGHGTSNFCIKRNNCLGVGAVDWDPDQAYTYENMEQAVVEYMRLIRKNFPEAWAERKNPDMVIFRLKYNSQGLFYASDPDYVAKVKSQPEWNEK